MYLLPREGMWEIEGERMEEEAVVVEMLRKRAIELFVAVDRVEQEWVADELEVLADLMLTAGLDLHFNVTGSRECFEHLVMGYRIDERVMGASGQFSLNRPLSQFDSSRRERTIPLDPSAKFAGADPAHRLGGARKDDHTGCPEVEPVHHSEFRMIFFEEIKERSLPMSPRRNHEFPIEFIHNKQMLILVQDAVDADVFHGGILEQLSDLRNVLASHLWKANGLSCPHSG